MHSICQQSMRQASRRKKPGSCFCWCPVCCWRARIKVVPLAKPCFSSESLTSRPVAGLLCCALRATPRRSNRRSPPPLTSAAQPERTRERACAQVRRGHLSQARQTLTSASLAPAAFVEFPDSQKMHKAMAQSLCVAEEKGQRLACRPVEFSSFMCLHWTSGPGGEGLAKLGRGQRAFPTLQ